MKNTEATATAAAGLTESSASSLPPTWECDGELLRRFASAGDQSAFSQVVARHAPMVLRMCRRMCNGDTHAAEDLAQRVFLDLASRAAALQTRTSIAGWLYRTSWNVSARYRRDQATREAYEREAGAARTAEGDGKVHGDVPFAVVTSELCEALSRALASLPESHRDALVLHYFGGHTVGQTAEVLGVRVGTVAAWLSRGRDLLRAHLQRHGATLSTNVVEAWLGEEAARMLLFSPREGTIHALEGKVGTPVATAFAAGAPLLAAAAGSGGGATAGGLLAWGSMLGLSRFATYAIIGCLTVGGAGIATAAVVPVGFGAAFKPFGGTAPSPATGGGGSQLSSAPPTYVTRPSADASSRAAPSGYEYSASSASSVPEPTGLALIGGAATLVLRRGQRRRRAPVNTL